MASFQGKIWVAGGCNAWNAIRSVEIYDPVTNTWKEGPSLSTPRRGCGLAVHQGHLIVVGGSDGTHSLCTTGLATISFFWFPLCIKIMGLPGGQINDPLSKKFTFLAFLPCLGTLKGFLS